MTSRKQKKALDAAARPARVIDTIVGAAIGIVFAVIFSSLDDRAYLARRHKKLKLWWH